MMLAPLLPAGLPLLLCAKGVETGSLQTMSEIAGEILPGTPVDSASVDLSTTILGQQMKFPIFISPNSFQVALHPDGEIGTHRGATRAGIPSCKPT